MLSLSIFAVALGAISPFFRRRGRSAAVMLAVGAGILAVIAITNFINQDPRSGTAAIRANRGFDLPIIACESPAFVLALASLKRFGKLGWLGWGLHVALSVWLVVVIIWIEFFWHW